MTIKKAVFAGSSERLEDRPKVRYPEFAFIGRSNVGKSSLINCLCNTSELAHTSSTPGKTQVVNHFLINDSWYLVDLPGYGYARMGREGRAKLARMIDDFIQGSGELVLLFVLLDSRHDLQKVDLDFMLRLGAEGIPFAIIYTKGDKSGTRVLKEQVEKNNQALLEYWEELPPVFVSSAKSKAGRDEITEYIESVLKTLQPLQ